MPFNQIDTVWTSYSSLGLARSWALPALPQPCLFHWMELMLTQAFNSWITCSTNNDRVVPTSIPPIRATDHVWEVNRELWGTTGWEEGYYVIIGTGYTGEVGPPGSLYSTSTIEYWTTQRLMERLLHLGWFLEITWNNSAVKALRKIVSGRAGPYGGGGMPVVVRWGSV